MHLALMKNNAFQTLSLLLFLLFSCTQEQEFPVAIKQVDGVQIIINPEYPQNRSAGYELREILTIGVDEGDENYMFYGVRDIDVDPKNNIYVLDDQRIQVFTQEGLYLRTLGEQGQGPGEMAMPCGMATGGDGKVYFVDMGNSRTTIFAPDGEIINEFRITGQVYTDIFVDNTGLLYLATHADFKSQHGDDGYFETKRIMDLNSYTTSGSLAVTFGRFTANHFRSFKRGHKHISGVGGEKIPTRWAVDPDGNVYVADIDQYEIHVYSKNGKLFRKFGRKFERIEYTQEEIDEDIDSQLLKNIPQSLRKKLVFTKWKPVLKQLLLDDRGQIWVGVSQRVGEDGFAYDIFNADGIYIARAKLKKKLRLIKNGYAYTRVSMFEGVATVSKHRLVFSPQAN